VSSLSPQYDGERAQLHLTSDGQMAIYSRNSEDHTPKYPDLIARLPRAFHSAHKVLKAKISDVAADKQPSKAAKAKAAAKVAAAVTAAAAGKTAATKAAAAAAAAAAASAASVAADDQLGDGASASASSSPPAASTAVAVLPVAVETPSTASLPVVSEFIIDCEVVAWDRVARKILPFQTLSTRKKKDVDTADITVQVCLFAFDLLFINGKSYLEEPLLRRREVLKQHFHEVEGEFLFATHKDVAVEAPSVHHTAVDTLLACALCWAALTTFVCLCLTVFIAPAGLRRVRSWTTQRPRLPFRSSWTRRCRRHARG